MIKLKVNRKDRTADDSRENIGLTGTKFGCGMATCGARTVHLAKWGEVARIVNVRLDQ